MALTVARNVDNKALVGELALLDNVAVLSEDAALLSNVALLGKIAALGKLAFLGLVATGIITSILLALMQLLRCPHCRRRPGGLAAHPFMGVNARLLVLGLFGVFPARSAPFRAYAPSSSDSSESIF